MNIEKARFNMVEQQVRPWRVADGKVLALMQSMAREDFVPAPYRDLAFADCEIPLSMSARMFSPKLVARLLEAAAVKPTDKVLEIGTGSGYMTALLAQQAHLVVSLEIDPALAKQAQQHLAGVPNVRVQVADGIDGAPEEAPFDLLVLNGAMAEVPPALLAQVKDGGRVIAIVGSAPVFSAQKSVRKGTEWQIENLFETTADPLLHFPQGVAFTL